MAHGLDPRRARHRRAALARVQPLDLHREHAHRHGARARDRLLAVRRLPLSRGAPARRRRGGRDRASRARPRAARCSSAAAPSSSRCSGCCSCRRAIMRSLAAGAIIVGVVSVAAALTLLPALLGLLGDRVNSLRVPVARAQPRPRRRRSRAASGGRSSSACCAGRRSAWCSPPGDARARRAGLRPAHRRERRDARCPDSVPSKQGYVALQRAFPAQSPYPAQIVVQGGGTASLAHARRARARAARPTRASAPATIQTSLGGHTSRAHVPVRGDAVARRRGRRRPRPALQAVPAALAGTGAQRARRRARPSRTPSTSTP